MQRIKTDFLIVGAGIIGLTMAINLKERYPRTRITIIDKECDVAMHASGRNSGVLHAGFYYSSDSLKARFTREGCLYWHRYCEENGLKINRCGKVVVARDESELEGLYELKRRAEAVSVNLQLIDEKELKELEPKAKTCEKALWSPSTATVDPVEICQNLKKRLTEWGVSFLPSTVYKKAIDNNTISTSRGIIETENLINAAGLYADRIARDFGVAEDYTILPFKGIYLEYSEALKPVRRNIYPVPDLSKPFLGVHFTVRVDGRVKIGPTAIPAFWRENYGGLKGFSLKEFLGIGLWDMKLFLTNKNGFRTLAVKELKKYNRQSLRDSAASLVNGIDMSGFKRWGPSGIRAQLINKNTGMFVMDFVVEKAGPTVHILNSVSPAFTASYPFTKWVVEKFL